MNKNFWKAAFNRAARTTAQELVTTLPVGFAITPVMIQTASWSSVWIAILCWLATGLLGGVGSLLTSIATGLPEAEPKTQDVRTIYLDEDGREIDPRDLQVEQDGTITVLAYDEYDEDGSPVVDKPCEACDLTPYLEGNADGDN